MNEAQTIAQAQQGDLSAFNRLVLAHQGIAFNVAYRIMGDTEAAADVCQDAFLSAYRHIRSLRGASFKSWLLRIVTNACYDRLRYQRRRPVSSLEEITGGGDGDNDPDHSPWLIDAAAGPEEVTMNRQLAGLIQQSIASLPPDQRVIVVLSDVQGMSYQEIAEITGVALGTVKSRLSRARARLRDYLTARPELLPPEYRLSSVEK
jgi:RNA polymerase sigma-70 factor (ECF subfamily)